MRLIILHPSKQYSFNSFSTLLRGAAKCKRKGEKERKRKRKRKKDWYSCSVVPGTWLELETFYVEMARIRLQMEPQLTSIFNHTFPLMNILSLRGCHELVVCSFLWWIMLNRVLVCILSSPLISFFSIVQNSSMSLEVKYLEILRFWLLWHEVTWKWARSLILIEIQYMFMTGYLIGSKKVKMNTIHLSALSRHSDVWSDLCAHIIFWPHGMMDLFFFLPY